MRFPGFEDVAVYGCLGVDLFFVISGFVIAWSSEGRTASAFVRARFLRLWPGFAFCATLTALTLALARDPNFPVSLPQWLANLIFLPQLLRQPFLDGAYWTIVAEITFYAWVSLAMAAGLFPRRLILLGSAWLALAVANHTLLHSGLIKHLFLTNYAGAFLGGVLIYRLARAPRDAAAWALLAACVAVSLGFGAVGEIREFQQGLGYDMNPWIMRALTALAFALVALASRLRFGGRAERAAYVAGGLTYPTYLLHQNIEYVLSARLVALGVAPMAAFLLVATGVLAAAYGVFRFVEPRAKAALARVLDRATQRRQAPDYAWLFGRERLRAGRQNP